MACEYDIIHKKRFPQRYDIRRMIRTDDPPERTNGDLYSILLNCSPEDDIYSEELRLLSRLVETKGKRYYMIILDGYRSISENLESAVNTYSAMITGEDNFLFAMLGAGKRMRSPGGYASLSYFSLKSKADPGEVHYFDRLREEPDLEGKAVDFSDLCSSIDANLALYYFGQSYGGGFASCMGSENSIGVSSSSPKEKVRKSRRYGIADHFCLPFFDELFCGSSVMSAFKDAAKESRYSSFPLSMLLGQTPQLCYQNIDPAQAYL